MTTSSSLPLEARARLLSLSSRIRCLRSRSSCGRSLSLSLLLSLLFAIFEVVVVAAAEVFGNKVWHANGEALRITVRDGREKKAIIVGKKIAKEKWKPSSKNK